MHWGRDPVLEKHYVPSRSQRARSVLTFFGRDPGTHNLVYASADLSKATQAREAIAFCDHWKQVSGADPKMLIMDQKVATQEVLGELDQRGVKFATLRMRSASLMKHINGLDGKDYKTITLDRPGPHNRPKVHEDPAVALTSYPGTVCPATPPSPPTPSSGDSWKPPARSSPAPTRSQSASNAAPSHPSSGQPTCPQPPPSPGGKAAPSATSSPESCPDPPAWKSALADAITGRVAVGIRRLAEVVGRTADPCMAAVSRHPGSVLFTAVRYVV